MLLDHSGTPLSTIWAAGLGELTGERTSPLKRLMGTGLRRYAGSGGLGLGGALFPLEGALGGLFLRRFSLRSSCCRILISCTRRRCRLMTTEKGGPEQRLRGSQASPSSLPGFQTFLSLASPHTQCLLSSLLELTHTSSEDAHISDPAVQCQALSPTWALPNETPRATSKSGVQSWPAGGPASTPGAWFP